VSNPNIILSGRIGTDIESRKMPDGTMKAKFRIITSDRRKNERGEWEDKDTSGWTVVAWDNLANKVVAHLSKGDPVIIQGTIKEVSWTDQEGNKKKSTETRASDIAINLYALKKEVDSVSERDDEIQW
jgi:single-strand DNA-binding protein